MLQVFRFDLYGWLRGDVTASDGQVIALLRALPMDSPFQAHLQASAEQSGTPAPEDKRTVSEKTFDKRVAELELFGFENQLRAMGVNASAGQTVIELPARNISNNPEKPTTARELYARFGGDLSLLKSKPHKE